MSIINLRTKAAFGGVMGKDGRKAYVGGSYADTSPGSGVERGTYQGKDDSGGYGGTYSGGGSDNRSNATQTANNAAAIAAGIKAAKEAREKEVRDQIAKSNLEKSNYGKAVNIFDYGKKKINQRNTNYKKKQLARYQKDKIDELNAKLSGLDNFDGFYGDTDETYADFINNYAPSVTKFGTPTKNNNFTGTGKYSKEFIDDVLSGKRTPPESFAKIDSKYPSMAVMAANFLGPKMGGPTTKEELMDIYTNNKTGNSYTGARDFDINLSTGKDMMKIFEPNRYKREYGPQESESDRPYIPINYNTGAGTTEDEYTNDFTYRFGDGQKIGRDVTLGYLANGGRAGKADGGIMGTRARRAMGGIMGRVDQRQGYFLGKIVKGVKSAVSGVVDATTKVLKSDFGKAALLAGGAYYLGGGGNPFTPGGRNAFSFSNIPGAKTLIGLKDSYDGMGTLGQIATMGGIGLGLSMIPGLNKPKPNEDSYADRGGSLIDPLTGKPAKPAEMRSSLNDALANANGDPARIKRIQDAYAFLPPDERLGTFSPYRTYGVKDGGRIGKAEGGLLDLGGMEKDYRAEGGFVPIGEYEKKDDVPARLSVNEFVFTADAVRGAGGGDIDKGAEIMENMMENLENGGTISKESQGNKGAQQMFETSQRLGEVV